MKDIKQRLSLLTLASVSVVVLAAAPVYAHGGHGHGPDDEVATTLVDTDTPGSQPAVDDNTPVSSTSAKPGAQVRIMDLRNRGKDMVMQRREGKTPLGVKARQKVCENRQKAIDRRLEALNRRAQRHLDRLDGVLVKIQAYHSDHAATSPTNYDDLLASATTQQSVATNAVAALAGLGTTIDCSADDPAASLAAVKEASAATRDALKDYRVSLKNLVVALAQAHKTDTNTEETN